MRPSFIALGLLTLVSGCSKYVTEKVLPTGCVDKTYYLDEDQDGWGAMASDECLEDDSCLASCQPTGNFTARNKLDCDDSLGDAEEQAEGTVPGRRVTGKVGSICPQNLVQGVNVYAGEVFGSREYAAEISSTLSGSESASNACGEAGWGGRWGQEVPGGLATFPSMQGMFRLINVIEKKLNPEDPGPDAVGRDHYAAWVGVVPNADETAWVFETRTSVNAESNETHDPAELGFCGGQAPDISEFGESTPKRLALIRTFDTKDWCLGLPSDANPKSGDGVDVKYTNLAANFICERPRPDARCHVMNNDEPWLEPCSCRLARGATESDLIRYSDPASLLDQDKGLYFTQYSEKLCLDPSVTTKP